MRNYLKSAGFFAGKKILKPKLSKMQKSNRLEICKSWSMKSDYFYDNVIFSNESKFNLKTPMVSILSGKNKAKGF